MDESPSRRYAMLRRVRREIEGGRHDVALERIDELSRELEAHAGSNTVDDWTVAFERAPAQRAAC